jgi:hypothetical protein
MKSRRSREKPTWSDPPSGGVRPGFAPVDLLQVKGPAPAGYGKGLIQPGHRFFLHDREERRHGDTCVGHPIPTVTGCVSWRREGDGEEGIPGYRAVNTGRSPEGNKETGEEGSGPVRRGPFPVQRGPYPPGREEPLRASSPLDDPGSVPREPNPPGHPRHSPEGPPPP